MGFQNEIELISILNLPIVMFLTFSKYTKSLFSQFLLVIISSYLIILKPWISSILSAITFLFLLKHWANRKKNRNPKVQIDSRLYFDITRALLIILTTIAILMCDFEFWIPRYGKTEYYGVSLMDLGVGGFIYNSGTISSIISKKSNLISYLVLIFLGFLRLAVVKFLKFSVNPKEYGFHWNFYFTLAALKILFDIFNSNYNLHLGIALLTIHEIFLSEYKDTILSDNRRGVLLANKEGIASIIPYLGIFLIINSTNSYIMDRKAVHKDIKKSIFNTIWSLGLYLFARSYSEVSRRLTNLAFTSWIAFYYNLSFLMTNFILFKFSFLSFNSELITFSSKNTMGIFLFSNLILMVIKLIFDTEKMNYFNGNLLNIIYLVINFYAMPLISRRYKLFLFK